MKEKELFGEELARQPERALVNPAQPEESRILMAPLAAEAGVWGQIEGFSSKQDPKFKRMVELVDRCIVRRPNENVHGWQPVLECGGGVPWVIEARKNHLANVRGIAVCADVQEPRFFMLANRFSCSFVPSQIHLLPALWLVSFPSDRFFW